MRQFFTSKTFLAVLIFALVSATAGLSQFGKRQPIQFPYLSWTGWAIRSFVEHKGAPDIVFLGSSLMLVPLDGVDADHLNQRIDGSQHHHSQYFQERFLQKSGLKASTFNFALPGEMPSDAYMITKYFLKDEKRPSILVYGVGPRDFMDNLLPSPSATDPFRFLSRFGDISTDAARFMPNWVDRLSFELGKLVYFYGNKEDLCDNACQLASNQVGAVSNGASLKQLSFDEKRVLLPEYRPFELKPGQAFFRPTTPAQRKNFADNLDEYRKRYKKLNWNTFIGQMHFLSDTLAIAKQRGIQTVVLAMPITALNRSLLSDINWSAYRNSLKAVAASNGATFVDLSESNEFTLADFGDTVHLHSGGGKRLMDLLVDRLATSRAITSTLKDRSLATKPKAVSKSI